MALPNELRDGGRREETLDWGALQWSECVRSFYSKAAHGALTVLLSFSSFSITSISCSFWSGSRLRRRRKKKRQEEQIVNYWTAIIHTWTNKLNHVPPCVLGMRRRPGARGGGGSDLCFTFWSRQDQSAEQMLHRCSKVINKLGFQALMYHP